VQETPQHLKGLYQHTKQPAYFKSSKSPYQLWLLVSKWKDTDKLKWHTLNKMLFLGSFHCMFYTISYFRFFFSFFLMGDRSSKTITAFLFFLKIFLSLNVIHQRIFQGQRREHEIQISQFCYLIIQLKHFVLRMLTLTLIAWLRFVNSLSVGFF
jgi:hypothetical protein